MYTKAANTVRENKESIAAIVSNWVEGNHPNRTTEYDKCKRDVGYIIQSLSYCLDEGNSLAIDHVARMFFKGGMLQLKSTDVELEAYDILLIEVEKVLTDAEIGSFDFCKLIINRLKKHLVNGYSSMSRYSGFDLKDVSKDFRLKHIFYNFDQEMATVLNMQKCQRNWDYSKKIPEEIMNYLLWHAENAPSKQHEAYYDVYWTADRNVIEECSKYTWGSTHTRNPPSTWRNSQANANMYILFVAKQPESQLNCNADGTLKDNSHHARWENSYVSIGIAMGLVMRAANAIGFATGCNKSHGDLNGNMFWEKKLGILDEVLAGTKKITYGIGIGFPQEGRPRWETDETELAIGAGNGSHLTTYNENDPEWKTRRDLPKPWDKKFRKVKIVDINTTDEEVDPYGNVHVIPNTSDIKINTFRKRIINVREIK